MANAYRTRGSLTEPVTDLSAARTYLKAEEMGGMTQFVKHANYPGLEEVVHHIEWDLLDEDTWQVTVITHRELTPAESEGLSEWISGQNSDGLGEGFEQQPFAEHEDSYGGIYDDEDEETEYSMSSFDWRDNPCKLEEVVHTVI